MRVTAKDFYTNYKISQNESVLATNKQNEKQRKIIKVHENVKISRKKFEEQTKGTPPRKMFAQI